MDSVSARIAEATLPFVQTRIGKLFLSVVIVGPLTFLPTVYVAWTASNIDSLRTLTWPLMIVVNISATLGVIHNGDWRMRLTMLIWVLMMAAVFIATLVR
ncbi:MAG: hypothetical protein AAB355_00390 [Patescibacteria group bacterium]